jgi:hypothetical protein
MYYRILRGIVVLCVLIVAYQAYVLLAVPLMEPPLAIRQRQRLTEEQANHARTAVTTYQLLLSNYFPKDHWSQTRPPKVIASSNEQAMLVLDDYHRQEDGRVKIDRFALLVFPTPPREGITPPRDAIILEAPQGAQLEFDEFRPELGRIGQITRGQFPGRITIRSDMHEPGPQDDLLVETADLIMNTKLLYTTSPVRFRMGANEGSGQELEIRFLTDEHAGPRDTGLRIGGIDALEIRHGVRMRLQLESDLLPGKASAASPGGRDKKEKKRTDQQAEPSTSPSAQRSQSDKRPPVEITCSGPFNFDFVRYVASLDRDVELRQLNPNGPSDQLSCMQLDLHFAPRELPGNGSPIASDPAKRQQRELGRLEPVKLVAAGHPVVVSSPGRGAEARGDRIELLLREQYVRISGGRNSLLVAGPNVLRAPTIEYQHPNRASASSLGRFRATGPGSLHYLPDLTKPAQIFQAAWQTSVELNRENGQPVLALVGRPQMALAGVGTLTADQIKVYLRELDRAVDVIGLSVESGTAEGGKVQVVPDRLAAAGRVEIHLLQLSSRTGELLADFRLQPVAPQSPTTNASTGKPDERLNTSLTDQRPFLIESDKMRMAVNLHGQSATPSSLACEGNVLLREVPLPSSTEQPLEIRGAQLTVDRLDTPIPYISLRGSGSGEADGAKLAQLAGRGMNVRAALVEAEVEKRDLRMWSNGPGNATLLVTRDLDGAMAATPFPLEIQWHGGLQFDGRTIVVERNVLVMGGEDTLRCDRLTARLAAPIQVGQSISQQPTDVAEIDCQGHVALEHRERDAEGVTSYERMQLARLTINQQTGAISGAGPGVILSTRYSLNLAMGNTEQGTPAKKPEETLLPATPLPQHTSRSKLHFLRVDFYRGLRGNLYTREVTFMERVRAVYGPVDSWEQELDAARPELLPPEAITLACDRLRINEDPIAARAMHNAQPAAAESLPIGPVQVIAEGNVRITGRSPSQGAFTAEAQRATFEQAKDAFVLEGDGRTPVRLWRDQQQGEPPAVQWIRYSRATDQWQIRGVEYLEITPTDIEHAQQSRQVR